MAAGSGFVYTDVDPYDLVRQAMAALLDEARGEIDEALARYDEDEDGDFDTFADERADEIEDKFEAEWRRIIGHNAADIRNGMADILDGAKTDAGY